MEDNRAENKKGNNNVDLSAVSLPEIANLPFSLLLTVGDRKGNGLRSFYVYFVLLSQKKKKQKNRTAAFNGAG